MEQVLAMSADDRLIVLKVIAADYALVSLGCIRLLLVLDVAEKSCDFKFDQILRLSLLPQ